MIDFNKLVNEALADMENDGTVKKVIRAQLDSTVKSIVSDLFRSYGPFGKQLETGISEALEIDLENLDLPSYNTLIRTMIQEHLDATVKSQGLDRMKEQIDEMLAPAKKEYKLSEIIEQVKDEELQFDNGLRGQSMTLYMDDKYSLIFIRFDPQPGVSEHRCKYGITVSKQDGIVQSVKIDGIEDPRSKDIMSGFHGVEKVLFRLYATKAKLDIDGDVDDMPLYYKEEWEEND